MNAALLRTVVVVAMAIAANGCSGPNTTNPPASKQSTGEAAGVGTGGAGANLKDDNDFVRDVAIKNMAAVELSRIALEKATNLDVKSFAQQMVEDHNAAGDKLKSVVSGAMEWPGQLDDKHRKAADELAEKQGADFDHEYVKAMVDEHQDLAAKLESRLDMQSVADWKTAAAGRTEGKGAMPEPGRVMQDVQVRPGTSNNAVTVKINQWAAETYPVAQKHLDTARKLETATKKRSTN